MARLRVLAVSAKLPAWAETACEDYARRMPKGYEVERIAVKNEGRLPAAVTGSRWVVLDERGVDLSTAQFSKLLAAPTTFVIGGAGGLSAETKGRANTLLRLSAMTLPHAIAQVVLLEQIYRAATLLTGHPYHRE